MLLFYPKGTESVQAQYRYIIQYMEGVPFTFLISTISFPGCEWWEYAIQNINQHRCLIFHSHPWRPRGGSWGGGETATEGWTTTEGTGRKGEERAVFLPSSFSQSCPPLPSFLLTLPVFHPPPHDLPLVHAPKVQIVLCSHYMYHNQFKAILFQATHCARCWSFSLLCS